MRPLWILVGSLGFLAVVMGLRAWLHRRRTGSWGIRTISGEAGSLEWWAGASFVVGALLYVLGPLLVLAGLDRALVSPRTWTDLVGVSLAGLGAVGTWWGQTSMGDSWRVGVCDSERTQLVTNGVFRFVRNPIFTSLMTAAAGVTLLLPSVAHVFAFACLVTGIELQVRFVEERHLARVHGDVYASYLRSVGRFFPLIGRARHW